MGIDGAMIEDVHREKDVELRMDASPASMRITAAPAASRSGPAPPVLPRRVDRRRASGPVRHARGGVADPGQR